MNKENSKDNNTESSKRVDTDWINDLYNNYVSSYVDQLTNAMSGNTTIQEYFKRDDSVNGIPHPEHIMYKLIVNPKHSNNPIERQNAYHLKPYDNPDTEISTDPHRRYEFVIEFDKGTPGYGIYYGCRGLIRDSKNKEDSIEQAKRMYEEWASIENTVTTVLNNTFPKKDFTKSYRHTNNDDNYTFWPFWIALGDNEDILGIAVRATTIICRCYQCLLLDMIKPTEFHLKNINNSTTTYFTYNSYQSILEKISSEYIKFSYLKYNITADTAKREVPQIIELFKAFIKKAESKGYIARHPLYEKAWRILKKDGLDNHTFYAILVLEWALLMNTNSLNKNVPDKTLKYTRSILNNMYASKKDVVSNEVCDYKCQIKLPQKIFEIFLTFDGCLFNPGKLKNEIKDNGADLNKIKKIFNSIQS